MEQTTTVITVTDRAAGKIRQLAAKEGRTEPVLRVRVVAGGCSGFSYDLSFADAPEGDDHVIHGAEGVRVLVDRRSAPIVEGSTLEFNDAPLVAASRCSTRAHSTSVPAATRSPSELRLTGIPTRRPRSVPSSAGGCCSGSPWTRTRRP